MSGLPLLILFVLAAGLVAVLTPYSWWVSLRYGRYDARTSRSYRIQVAGLLALMGIASIESRLWVIQTFENREIADSPWFVPVVVGAFLVVVANYPLWVIHDRRAARRTVS